MRRSTDHRLRLVFPHGRTGRRAEGIVCCTGACSPDRATLAHGGPTDVRVVPVSGSESRDFEVATDPAMLAGWDHDADGASPPFDADDIAVLDGTGLERAISVRNSPASRFEFAHFEAREYGRVGNAGGFFAQGPSHNYLHDIELSNINREMPTPSGRIVALTHNSGWTPGTRSFRLNSIPTQLKSTSRPRTGH